MTSVKSTSKSALRLVPDARVNVAAASDDRDEAVGATEGRTVIHIGHARRGPPGMLAVAAIVLGGSSKMVVRCAFLGGLVDFGQVSVPPVNEFVANLAAVLFGIRVAVRDVPSLIVGVLPETLEALKKPRVRRSWRCMTCVVRDLLERHPIRLSTSAGDAFMYRLASRYAREALERGTSVGGSS